MCWRVHQNSIPHPSARSLWLIFRSIFCVTRKGEREIVIEEHRLIEQSLTLHAPDARCLVCCVDTFIYSFIMFGFCLIYSHFVTWSAIRKWYSVFCINDMMIYQKDCQFSLALTRTVSVGRCAYALAMKRCTFWLNAYRGVGSPPGINNNLCTHRNIKETNWTASFRAD